MFDRVKFPPEVLRAAKDSLSTIAGSEAGTMPRMVLSVRTDAVEAWSHDSEAEFFADYRRQQDQAVYGHDFSSLEVRYCLRVMFAYGTTDVRVSAPTRAEIERVMHLFEDAAEQAKLPDPPKAPEPAPRRPTIFIGHGRDFQWRDLKDHLAEKHGFDVLAYESGARAGHGIRDILDDLVRSSTFAVLLLTAEDATADGDLRARQSVVHEVGLFQGKLGFTRAIALLEEGAEEFSNIHGINQIRFTKGNIQATFGEVLATIRREFGPS